MYVKKFFLRIYTLIVLVFYTGFTSFSQHRGCTDAAANNYDSAATVNNGSCTYNAAFIKPALRAKLAVTVTETSGLIYWNKTVWTHNDSGGEPALYAVDSATGKVIKKVTLTNAANVDWEDLAQDDTYIYIGDFGNNANGNRTDLKIYRVRKKDVKNKTTVTASVISFSYNDQTDFGGAGNNHTNFDCEAMIAYHDSLFLFSKNWTDNKTRLYKLPKKPGSYAAVNIGEWNVKGLITGAEIVADKKLIVLTGYDNLVSPFLYLLYGFTGNRFFDANKRKISISESFLQAEGICAVTDTKFYISNERFQQFIIVTPAKLQTVNLAAFLNPYYTKQSISVIAAPHHTNAISVK